jgi:hypothetical protein
MDKIKEFKVYRRTQITEMRPYIVGEEISKFVYISLVDIRKGSPKQGDMIARNPKNHADQWLIAKDDFQNNYEEIIKQTE